MLLDALKQVYRNKVHRVVKSDRKKYVSPISEDEPVKAKRVEAGWLGTEDGSWGPLRRWLRGRVGDSWNEIFSDLCAATDQLGIPRKRLKGVLRFLVSTQYTKVDDELMDPTGYLISGFYVDNANILRFKDYSRYKFRPRRPDYIKVDDLHQYRQIQGIWYFLTLRPFPEKVKCDVRYDPLVGFFTYYWNRGEFIRFYGGPYTLESKRQLNSKEIKRLKSSKLYTDWLNQ